MKTRKAIWWSASFFVLLIAALSFYWIGYSESEMKRSRSNADTTGVNSLLKQSESYFNKPSRSKQELDSSLLTNTSAYQISRRNNFQKGIGTSLNLYSKIYNAQGDTLKGRQYADSAISVFKNNDLYYELGFAYYNRSGFCPLDSKLLNQRIEWVKLAADAFVKSGSKLKQADIFKELGDLQQYHMNYKDALESLQKSIHFYDSAHRSDLIGLYDLLGEVHGAIGNYRLALKYGFLALKTAEKFNDTTSRSVATIYNRIGVNYERMKRYQMAYQYFSKGQQICLINNDTTNWLYITRNKAKMLNLLGRTRESIQENLRIPEDALKKNKVAMGRVHAGLMMCYLKLKEFDECRKYCKLLLVDHDNLQEGGVAYLSTSMALAQYYIEMNELKKAESYLTEIDSTFRKIHAVSELSILNKIWSRVDSARGDLAGYIRHIRQFQILHDSSLSELNNKEVAQLQIEYETEKKDRDIVLKAERIKLLNAENHIQQVNLQQARLGRNVTIGGVFLLIVIIVLLYSRYRFNKKISKQVNDQNASLNQLNTSLNLVVKEKEWLLKEIHHRVKNNLQIIISLLGSQSVYLKDDAALSAIRDSQSRVHCMSLIHKKLYQSESIATINMKVYIKELVEDLVSAFGVGKTIYFELDIDELHLNTTQAIPIGLILNEAITNSIKYAFPQPGLKDKITISLSVIFNQCRLLIHDNGVGLPSDFNEDNVKTLGVSLIKGLSEDIDANLSIKNDNGTCVEILFTVSPISPLLELPDQLVTV